jgi:hypothetical protein
MISFNLDENFFLGNGDKLISSTFRTVNNAVVDETSNLRGSVSVQPISEAVRKKRLRTHETGTYN